MKQLSEKDSKLLAEAWADRYGASLAAEAEAMRQQGVSYQTPRADQAVLGIANRRPGAARRRRRSVFAVFAAAACLVLVALVVGVPFLMLSPTTESGAPTSSMPSDLAAPEPGAQMLPITFSLPADFRVAQKDFDNGVSLYTLESPQYGDVVLAMHPEDGLGLGAMGDSGALPVPMDEVVIDGAVVSAKVVDAYMLLVFQHGEVHYTLSSRDNMGALVAFYRSIVRAPV